MKHLTLVAGLVASSSLPVLAQAVVGGPVELHNPHRRGADSSLGGGGVGGLVDTTPGVPGYDYFGGNPAFISAAPTPPVTPPSVAMFVDGPYLFVLRGDSLYQFDKKTLKLLNSTQLPQPVLPTPPPSTKTPAQADIRTQASPPLRPAPNF